MAESEEELNTLLTKVKEESEKSGLNPAFKNLRSWHMVITSWQKDGEKMETATDFIFLGSKITVDGNCHHEINKRFFLERKAMTNLDRVFKKKRQRHHFADRGKAVVFPVVMYSCENWTIKKAEH